MLRQGAAESSALWSNMSDAGQRLVDEMVADSDEMAREDVLHMVRQGLHSFRLQELVDIGLITQLGLLGSMTNKATRQDYQRIKTAGSRPAAAPGRLTPAAALPRRRSSPSSRAPRT